MCPDEEGIVRLLRAMHANDVENAPRRHRLQVDEDPDIGRIWAAFTGARPWNEEELEYAARSAWVKLTWRMMEDAKRDSEGKVEGSETT